MNDATVIAAIILCGMFLIIIVTILKYGVDAALKLWTGMGAITGVALGSIITFYFTNQTNREITADLEMTNTVVERVVERINEVVENVDSPAPSPPAPSTSIRENVNQEIEISEQDFGRENPLVETLEAVLEELQAIRAGPVM